MLIRKVTVCVARIPLLMMGIMGFFGIVSPVIAGAGQQPQFVLGEVMIKFRPGAEASAAVSRAIQSSPPNLDSLAPVARLLTEKVEIPLRAKQVSSGDWAVFDIDLDRLASQAAAQLSKRDGVTDVQLRDSEGSGINVPKVKDLDVTFRAGSSSSTAVEDKVAGASEGGFAALVDEMGRLTRLPLKGKAEAKSHLVLQIDLQALTSLLAERLRGSTDIVESAQLNYIMTGM